MLYFTPHCVPGSGGGGGAVLPYKRDGMFVEKILRTSPLKSYQNLFFLWGAGGVSEINFHPRGTNSTTTNYITGTANFNSNKDNFRTLSSQGLFESIVINLTETTLGSVILGFSFLSSINPQI